MTTTATATGPDTRHRALPLYQPFGSLVVRGIKTRETRSKPAPSTILGRRVAIHACRTTQYLRLCSAWPFSGAGQAASELPLGAIVGSVVVARSELITVEYANRLRRDDPREFELGDYTPGRYAWRLTGARELAEPIPTRPRSQGLFFVTPEVADQLDLDDRGTPNPMDTLTVSAAAQARDVLTFGRLSDVLVQLGKPGGSAHRADAHRALADVLEELAVLDAIAMTKGRLPDDVLPAHNSMVRLLAATGEAEAARAGERPREKARWPQLEAVAGDILDAITAACENDNTGLAQLYQGLREQLALENVTPAKALHLLQAIENGCRVRGRMQFGIADVGPKPADVPIAHR